MELSQTTEEEEIRTNFGHESLKEINEVPLDTNVWELTAVDLVCQFCFQRHLQKTLQADSLHDDRGFGVLQKLCAGCRCKSSNEND